MADPAACESAPSIGNAKLAFASSPPWRRIWPAALPVVAQQRDRRQGRRLHVGHSGCAPGTAATRARTTPDFGVSPQPQHAARSRCGSDEGGALTLGIVFGPRRPSHERKGILAFSPSASRIPTMRDQQCLLRNLHSARRCDLARARESARCTADTADRLHAPAVAGPGQATPARLPACASKHQLASTQINKNCAKAVTRDGDAQGADGSEAKGGRREGAPVRAWLVQSPWPRMAPSA